jgi:hypothetical protein
MNVSGNGELFMETPDSKSVKRLAKSQFLIIALLAIFACVFAAIVLQHFGDDCFKTDGLKMILPYDDGLEITHHFGNDSVKTDGLKTTLPYDNGLKTNVFTLLCFLAGLPLICFTSFGGLVILHYIKSFNFKNEEDFRRRLKADIMNEMSPLMEKAINSSSKKTMEEIKEIFELFSKINSGNK